MNSRRGLTISGIQSYVDAIEKNSSLFEEKSFAIRTEFIEFLDFHVADSIEELLRKDPESEELILLKSRAEKLKSELEEINTKLFQRLRVNIRAGCRGKEFIRLIKEYIDPDVEPRDNERQGEAGYDNLDILVNGLCSFLDMPEQTRELEPEMVYYQKTPARIVFEVVKRSQFIKEDVFVDLGSGLGQVPILVNLLTGIAAKGVEFDPAFCEYSRQCSARLNLSNVTFINGDARKADYSGGTIFFMFTPFTGEIMREVLGMLEEESRLRQIKIFTLGPCTVQVGMQSWLACNGATQDNIYELGFFTSS